MASINLSGYLYNPLGEPDVGAIVTFTHASTTGNTINSSRTGLIVPPDGYYNIDLEYGNVRIDYESDWLVDRCQGITTVNQDTTATSLPELLNAIVPPTDEQLLLFQAILSDTVAAKDIAVAAAEQSTTIDLINNSNTYVTGDVIRTGGFVTKGDGGSGDWQKTAITGQTPSARVNFGLLNDADGNQWRLVCNGEVKVETFADLESLQPQDSDRPATFICTDRACASYLLMPQDYIALAGDAIFANGRVGELQITKEVTPDELGAGGDMVEDDTQPFRDALSRCKSVYLPNIYRITGQVVIPAGCSVYSKNGVGAILQTPTGKITAGGGVIAVDFGEGLEDLGVGITSVADRTAYFDNVAVFLETGASISGVSFHYPNQNMLNTDTVTNPPTPYPPAIAVDYLSERTNITNINIGNAYVGIDTRKKHNSCKIKDIYGAPLSVGIRCGSTTGFDDIRTTNFILANAYLSPTFPPNSMIDWIGINAKWIEQNRATWIDFNNIKGFGYNIGIDIYPSEDDLVNGLTETSSGQTCTYTGCGFDTCSIGIRGRDTLHLTFLGCSFAPRHKVPELLADTYSIYLDNTNMQESNITVTNCSTHDADMSAYYFKNVKNLSISNCAVRTPSLVKPGAGITLEGCDNAVVTGNPINGNNTPNTKGIVITDSSGVSVNGNVVSEINGSPIEIDNVANSSIQSNVGSGNSGFMVIDVSAAPRHDNVIINNVGTNINQDTTNANVNINGILELDYGRNFVSHSGGNDIKGINAGYNGQLLTLRFGASAIGSGLVDSDAATPQPERLFIDGNYPYTFSDTIQLVSRGSLGWYEVSRSVN